MKKIYVSETRNIGKGIYACRNIRKGETLFVAKGLIVHLTPAEADLASRRHLYDNAIEIGKGTWLDPIPGNLLNYINHSCNPNTGIRGTRTFVALRDIRKGEQIVYDYSTTQDDRCDTWVLECKCGEKNCRRKIKGVQSLPLETYKKLMPFIPKYFQSAYNESTLGVPMSHIRDRKGVVVAS